MARPRSGEVREFWTATDLRAELAAATGEELAAGATISGLRLDHAGEVLTFVWARRTWRRRLSEPGLSLAGEAPDPAAAMSPDGRFSVKLVGANLDLCGPEGAGRALTTDGVPGHGYGDFRNFISQVSMQLANAPPLPPTVLWSPDSLRLATLRADLRRVEPLHLVQSAPTQGARPVLHTYPFPMPGDVEGARLELIFLTVDGRRVRAEIEGLEAWAFEPLMLGRAWWGQDGRTFYLVDCRRDGRSLILWRIDSETGAAVRLLTEEGPGVVLPAPEFVEPAVCHVLSDGRLIWWSQRDGWGHLYLVDPAAPGPGRQITSGDWLVRGLLHVDEAQGRIWFLASGREAGVDPYFRQAYSVGFDGTDLRRLTPEDADHDFTAPLNPLAAPLMGAALGYETGASGVSPDGRYFVDAFDSLEIPTRSVVRDREGSVVLDLGQADLSASWPPTLPAPEAFRLTALDGRTELHGVLYRPAGFDPARSYPLVEIIYGGPQKTATPKSLRQTLISAFAEQMAVLGCAALVIDGPGTPYRSRAFQLATQGRIEICGGLDDHAAAIREVARTRPWIDLDSVGIMGASGGGYATARALADHPELYKVGVSFCGNHDQRAYIAMWGELYHGPYSPELYASQASASVAAAVTGRLLLIHGDMDDNVHPAHTLKLVDALIAADRDFDLLIVPNMAHMVMLHPYAARRAWSYFLEHLIAPPR